MDDLIALYGGKPVRKKKLYYGKQNIDSDDVAAVASVLRSDWLTQGPCIGQLESLLCRSFDAKYAVTSTSGTSALHLACIAAGIINGDEVITTPLTFSASANCIRYCGGKVVFADVCEDNCNIDPRSVEKKITDRTKAVVAVDYAGQPAQLYELKELCGRHGLLLIEDAAHSLGSVYQGRPVGGIADLTTFSFHPVKTITGGEGGSVLTNNRELAELMRLAANHGIRSHEMGVHDTKVTDAWYREQIMLGYNYRMTDIQAALIISQANKLTRFKQRRREIFEEYGKAFTNLDGIRLPREESGSNVCWHLYVIRIGADLVGCCRKEFFDALSAENIQPQVHYVPVHLHPYYRQLGHTEGECPIAEKIYSEILTLPLYPAMTDADVGDVVAAVRKVHHFYQGKREAIK